MGRPERAMCGYTETVDTQSTNVYTEHVDTQKLLKHKKGNVDTQFTRRNVDTQNTRKSVDLREARPVHSLRQEMCTSQIYEETQPVHRSQQEVWIYRIDRNLWMSGTQTPTHTSTQEDEKCMRPAHSGHGEASPCRCIRALLKGRMVLIFIQSRQARNTTPRTFPTLKTTHSIDRLPNNPDTHHRCSPHLRGARFRVGLACRHVGPGAPSAQ